LPSSKLFYKKGSISDKPIVEELLKGTGLLMLESLFVVIGVMSTFLCVDVPRTERNALGRLSVIGKIDWEHLLGQASE